MPGMPPPPPGLGAADQLLAGMGGSTSADEASSHKLRQEILSRIGEQVKDLILQAKRDSEAKVKTELKMVNDAMAQMDANLDMLNKQLDDMEESPTEALEQHTAIKALAKVEQQWGKELGKLKLELHQTIYAHNHNADLLKQQKEALDQIRSEIEGQKQTASADRIKLAKSQLVKMETLQKVSKGRKLEPLFQRLAAVEQRLMAAWRWQAMAAANAQLAGAAAAARPIAKASAGKVTAFFPEAEESVDKPAFRRPTDEEVQAQLAKFAAKEGWTG